MPQAGVSCVEEVIVVDNASSDGSAEMVAAEFPEVTLVRSHENLGFGRANNLAIARARGSHLALVNSDVVVHAGCLETLMSYLDGNANVGMVGPRIVGGDGIVQRTCRRLPTVWNHMCRSLTLDRLLSSSPTFSGYEMRHFEHDVLVEAEVLSGCFLVVRNQAVKEVGGFDEQFFFYMEDVDWCRRFAINGWKVVFVPEASATHFGGASTALAPLRYSIQIHRANLQYWGKYNGRAGKAAYFLISVTHHGLRFVARGLGRLVGLGGSAESQHKLREDIVCLRWFLAGKDV